MKRLLFCVLALGLFGADCNNPTPIAPRPIPVLESIAIESDKTTVLVTGTVTFTATGTLHTEDAPDEPYDEDVTALVFWDTSDPTILLVSPDGRARGLAPGTVTVTARTPDDGEQVQGAGLVSDPITITVNP